MFRKNVSRLTPQRRRTNLHKEPEKWLMFLSLLFASPSRLICLSRQTHQQLFFRGDRLLNTLLKHTLKRERRREEKSREIHWKRRNQLKIINYLALIPTDRIFFLLFSNETCHCSPTIFFFSPVSSSQHFRKFLSIEHVDILMLNSSSGLETF